ncbi:MAG TPA: MBL fold metallo-hydrolase [Gemmatimonadales bacterium]
MPGLETARYGGNTPCVSLENGPGVLVLDAGTGIRRLGEALTARGHGGPIDILLSHAHIDHIQGLPFFAPVHDPGARVRIHGPAPDTLSLHQTLGRLMVPPFWPAYYAAVAERLDVTEITAGEFQTDYFRIRAMPLSHPGRTLGYSITSVAGGPTVNYMTDNELGTWTGMPSWQVDLVGFLRNTEVLIHDATYGEDEIPHRTGWGHSGASQAVDLAVAAGVRKLILFHHAPEHTDSEIDRLLAEARRRVRGAGVELDVEAAAEGTAFDL